MSEPTRSFYKAPRYLFRKVLILKALDKYSDDIKTFVDVGCGAGELAITMASKGYKGLGLDFSDEAIEVARSIAKDRLDSKASMEFKNAELKDINQKFDLVMCFEVLEHVKDDDSLLRELMGKSKGILFISVPAKMRLFDESDTAVGHYRRYEKKDLIQMLEAEDLEILEFKGYGYPFTNIVRLLRKVFFKVKAKKNIDQIKEDKSKDSGINPVQLGSFASKIDLEPIVRVLSVFSSLFSKTNLAEGYFVVVRKK